MRCQKCGFISFDLLAACNKCGVDQTAKAPDYTGTGQMTNPPFFLAAALGDVDEQEAPILTSEESVQEEVQDGAAALFDELEAESQGMIPAEEPPEVDLSFDEAEEEIASPDEISLEIPAEDESLEIPLEIPEPEEEVVVEEIATEETPEPQESLEITLEIPEEEAPALTIEEPEAEAETAPTEEPLDLSLEMTVDEEETAEAQGLDVMTEPAATSSSLDLEEIDLSDLITDSGPAPAPANDNEEIFDLSSLMGDTDEEPSSDELSLTMDLSDEMTLDSDEDKSDTDAKQGDTPDRSLDMEK